jgi:beta-N-acetylhexosaminidase
LSSPKAIILGCEGTALTDAERQFFSQHQPLGFILFARNIESPLQTKSLVEDLRSCVSHRPVPVLIDQEGGRVARLPETYWRKPPAGAVFGELYKASPQKALRAIYLNYRLIAHDLHELGIDVDCAPLLDTRVETADEIVGDRAFSTDPNVVTELGRGVIAGLHKGGVLSVIKHLPTHGPAEADSHLELPVVDWTLEQLHSHFEVFNAHRTAPWGMTAHIVYNAIDRELPGTYSSKVIDVIIRDAIGFNGFLISDDLGMKALIEPWANRAQFALEAGCDCVLHCSGKMEEMLQVIEGVSPLSDKAQVRLDRGYQQVRLQSFNPQQALAEYNSLTDIRKAS